MTVTPETTWPGLRLALAALALGWGAAAAAAPRLDCRLQNGDVVVDAHAAPTTDPYRVPALPVNHFRFKAVVVGAADRVDYVTLYTYYEAGGRAEDGMRGMRLLHEVKYLAPQPQAGSTPASLTGTVYLYEPRLGREFVYDCALREVQA